MGGMNLSSSSPDIQIYPIDQLETSSINLRSSDQTIILNQDSWSDHVGHEFRAHVSSPNLPL